MAQLLPDPPPGFDTLAADKQLDYVQSLWQRIAAQPTALPVPAWHLNVIETRLPDYRDAPGIGKSWDEVYSESMRRLEHT